MTDKGLGKKLKEGFSVSEIEQFSRKYMTELFSCAAIIVAAVSSTWNLFTSGTLSIYALAIGTVVAIIFPNNVEKWINKFQQFMIKQDKVTQILIGVVRVVFAIFLPFLIFLVTGLFAGSRYHHRKL